MVGRECRRLVADRVISRARNNQVAFKSRRTSNGAPDWLVGRE
jgi:hypothetical protein